MALNNNYGETIGLIATNGLYLRTTNKALIKAIQIEVNATYVDGLWGEDTMSRLPTLRRYGSNSTQMVYILQYLLYLNGYNPNGFDGGFGAGVQSAVRSCQQDYNLTVDGVCGRQTWASLIVSCGDTSRAALACDTRFELTSDNIYNFSDPDSAFNTPFHGRPDSIVFWAKYIPGDRNASNAANQARLNAVITTDARYQDPEDDPAKYNDVRLAAGFVNYSATSDLGWQRIAVPFIYDPANLDKEPAYILTTFTTNMVPGGGSGTKDQPDKVYLDDAELIYNNHLLSLTRGDEAITFDGVSYKINETYCDSCGIFEGVEDGVSAQSFFAYDALHKCVFVYVIADDYAQSGKYTVYRIDYTDTNADGTSLDPKVPEEQGIEEIITHEARFEKVLINGQLFIRSNDAWYNASGVRVK